MVRFENPPEGNIFGDDGKALGTGEPLKNR